MIELKGCSGKVYKFEGPYKSPDSLEDKSGVYVILCYKNGKYYVIDVGESREVRDRVSNHERVDCWEKHCENGILMVAVLYTYYGKKPSRMDIEQDIRCYYTLPCGEK